MAVKVSGSGTGMALHGDVILADGRLLVDVSDAVTTMAVDYQVGAVSELQVGLADVDGKLIERGLLAAGTTLFYDGHAFEVSAVDLDYRGEAIVAAYAARSRLARRLRNRMGPSTTKGQTPAQWITQRVKAAGGKAVVQPGAKARAIHQKRNESVLDVISSLASDTGVEWCEVGNRLFCGTGWWALQGSTGLPVWPVSYSGKARTDVLSLSTRSSLDDRQEAASASVDVPLSVGFQWRPWHRVQLSGASKADNGIWLVQGVNFDLHEAATVSATLYRPLKSAPKKGSTSDDTTDGKAPELNMDGDWIDGADKVWPGCTRTPKQYTRWALAQILSSWPQNACLAWVSTAVKGSQGAGGGLAKYVWQYAPAGTPRSPGETNPPIGAIVVWGPPTGGNAGHVGISLGDGKFISATGGKVQILSINGFGSYLGAMAPNFGGNYPS